MRVGVLGRTTMLFNTAQLLIEKGYELSFIGTCKASPEYKITEKDFEKLAREENVPFFCDLNLNNHKDVMSQTDIVVSMNWVNIINEDIIALFPQGILNAHPGKLPQYRGNACPNWAILNGENEYAITIHLMKSGELDSGDIIVQRCFPILETTSITDIYETMYETIPIMFINAIEKVDEAESERIIQDNKAASRCYPRLPRDSFIDWNSSCEEIYRNIRASGPPFAGAYTYCKDIKCYIHSCFTDIPNYEYYAYPGQVVFRDSKNGLVKIAAKDGFVCFTELWVGGKRIVASELIDSTRIRLNYNLYDEVYELKKQIASLKEVINGNSVETI